MKQFLFLLVILIFLFYRLLYIDCDPFYTSWSLGGFTDIGFYLHNARHKILFDNFAFGSWDNRFLFPVYNYYYFVIFYIFGFGKYSVIFGNIFIQIIGIIFLYKLLNSIYKKLYFNIISIFIYSYLFNFINCQRIPYLENVMLNFLIVSIYYLFKESRPNYIGSAFSYMLSLMSKLNSIYLFPAYIFYILKNKTSVKNILKFFITILIFLIVWIFLMNISNPEIINYTIKNKPIGSFNIKNFLFNIYNTNIFFRMPIVTLCVYFYFSFLLLYNIKLNHYQQFLIFSFILIHICLLISNYLPERYYNLLLFFIYLIFIDFLNFIMNFVPCKKHLNILKIILMLLIFLLLSYNEIWVYHRSILNRHIFFDDILKLSLCLIPVNILLFIIWIYHISLLPKKFLISILIFSSFILNSIQFYNKIQERKYNVVEIQNYINNNLDKNKIITGWWAPTFAFYSKMKILPIYNEADYMKYDYDYIIFENESDKQIFYNKKLVKLKDFNIQYLNKTISIYKIAN